MLLFYTLQDIQKNGHSVCVENMKKEVRRPRHVREENLKNCRGENVYRKVVEKVSTGKWI